MKLHPAEHTNLVATWLAYLETLGESPTLGLYRLNASLGTATGLSRLGEWTRGERAPEARAFAWMLHDALPGVLAGMPLGPRQRASWLRTLSTALALPENRRLLRQRQAGNGAATTAPKPGTSA